MHRCKLLKSITLFCILWAWFAQAQSPSAVSPHIGLVLDWSTNRVIFGVEALKAQNNPRAIAFLHKNAQSYGRGNPNPAKNNNGASIDWSVSLGSGTIAADMSPAKYSFDVNATPNCVSDFVLYALNVAGSATQANLVALNYLYSGTTPSNGICNNLVGNGASATVMWAYNTGATPISSSPTLSMDGTKVAFVSNSSPAVFHVLAWTAGQGTVTAPVTPTGAQMTSVTLNGSTGASISSPYIDYSRDLAYVGSDNGILYVISGVFGGTPTLTASYTVSAGQRLSAPVWVDVPYSRIFVGAADGKLYSIAADLSSAISIQLGDGTTFGGITDPPLVDSTNDVVYTATGTSLASLGAGGSSVIAQVPADTGNFAQPNLRVAMLGAGTTVNVHSGTFNDAYYSAPSNNIGTTSEWFAYVCGPGGPSSKKPRLYRVGFDTSRLMNTTADANSVQVSLKPGEECTPLTEFLNGVDRIFFGLPLSGVVTSYDISSSTTPTIIAQVNEPGGASSIIVDNVSTQAQASSIYFSTLGTTSNCGNNYCAVKLTQTALQ